MKRAKSQIFPPFIGKEIVEFLLMGFNDYVLTQILSIELILELLLDSSFQWKSRNHWLYLEIDMQICHANILIRKPLCLKDELESEFVKFRMFFHDS